MVNSTFFVQSHYRANDAKSSFQVGGVLAALRILLTPQSHPVAQKLIAYKSKAIWKCAVYKRYNKGRFLVNMCFMAENLWKNSRKHNKINI